MNHMQQLTVPVSCRTNKKCDKEEEMCVTQDQNMYITSQQMNRSPCSNSDGKAKLSFTCSIYASLTIYFLLITYSCQHHTFEKQTASPRILKNSTHPSFTTLYKLLSINRHTGLSKKNLSLTISSDRNS